MFENKTEKQARDEILKLVSEYCDTYHNQKGEFKPGDRISYASRVYDHEEMCNLVDSALEFWLTQGDIRKNLRKRLRNNWGFVIVPLSIPVLQLI